MLGDLLLIYGGYKLFKKSCNMCKTMYDNKKCMKILDDLLNDIGINRERINDINYKLTEEEINKIIRIYELRTMGRNLIEDLKEIYNI